MLYLIFKKDISKKKMILLQSNLQNILENLAFKRTVKFIEIKGIVILVKVDEMYNIVKCLLATGRDMKVELDDQGFAGAEI